MQITFFLLKKKTAATIYVRYSHGTYLDKGKRKGRELKRSTGITVQPASWDRKRQTVKASDPAAPAINKQLDKIRQSMRAEALSLVEKGREPTPERVFSRVASIEARGDVFAASLAYLDAKQSGLSEATLRAYRAAFTKLREYLGPGATFDRLDHGFGSAFVAWMLQGGSTHGTAAAYLYTVKRFVEDAYRKGISTSDAFTGWRADLGSGDQVALTAEELSAVEGLDLEGAATAAAVRDCFLFLCYTGMRFHEASNLEPDQERGGVVYFQKAKTRKGKTRPHEVPLSRKALRIWKAYGGRLPWVHLSYFLRVLRDVCREAGVTAPVVVQGGKVRQKWQVVGSHTGRRTCATLLNAAGVEILTISRVLGHANVATTQRYIRRVEVGRDTMDLI